ncbi:dihydrolipoyl dehydrogenase [Pelagicoccus sp. SDUM812003]|uniref:dihydrolipoyl dehydrogenase n=1 Tax=Pelagicoccus sp. SDUM812003 TaxID=3041267 RepID=UPI00280F45D8|nr:dihydrolipoyl dehydrogenase [Pelagicoccus sp. SDUM812003]MDQ8203624.1 dihydrolipoyl dehydrogenase [Pelagicoccus sp. SDUM812003]
MADKKYDLIVVGGGPAGYAAAIRAGQLGKKVACVEMERAGGTCLNWGCIPSKALLKSAELIQSIKKAEQFGIKVGDVEYDFEKIIKRSRGVADQMAKGIEFLFKKNKVDYVVGKAQLTDAKTVKIVEGESKGQEFKTDHVLLATGCRARRLPFLPNDDPDRVMTSREALVMKKQPNSVAIIGSGAIGVEFAYFLNAFGTEVTILEIMPQLVPVEDEEIAKTLEKEFKKQGIKNELGIEIKSAELTKDGVQIVYSKKGKETTLEVDVVIQAVGVAAYLDGAVNPSLNLKTEKGFLVVDDRYMTNVAGIYAAGDIIGPPTLAHVATFEAVQAVNGMFGASKPRRVKNFPGATYCQPQIGSTGLTEKQAKEKGLDFKVGKFPFVASGKAVAGNHSEGFVKVISDAKTGEIFGAHVIGRDATELITEYCLAMEMEGTIDEIHGTIHAHPTMSEALAEAAADTHHEAIHI